MKRVIAVVLCLITVFSCFGICTYAASVSDSLGYNVPENSGDWAQYKSKRSSSTTKDEVKWMQKAINYCIDNRGLTGISKKLSVDGDFGALSRDATKAFQKAVNKAISKKKLSISKLDEDGSFGPATIKAMKTVLNKGNKTTLSTSSSNTTATTSTTNEGKITTEMIKAICDKYGYANGKYWTIYQNNGKKASGTWNASKTYLTNRKNCCSTINQTVKKDLYATNKPVTIGDYYKSYNYQNQYECHGFACYVMAKVVQSITGKDNDVNPKQNGNKNGWTKISAKNVTELKVGDIVRVYSSSIQHTAIVYSIDKNGKITFLEAGGGSACKIRLDVGFDFSSKYYTLQKIKDNFPLEYVYRYTG